MNETHLWRNELLHSYIFFNLEHIIRIRIRFTPLRCAVPWVSPLCLSVQFRGETRAQAFSCKLQVNVAGRSTGAESAVQRKRVEPPRWINQCQNRGASLLFYSPPQHQYHRPSLLLKRAPRVAASSVYLSVTGGLEGRAVPQMVMGLSSYQG